MISSVYVLLDTMVTSVKQTGMNVHLIHVSMQFVAM